MKNLLESFKRRKVRPITLHDVEAAPIPDQEKEEQINKSQLNFYKNVMDIAVTAGKIRQELVAAALIERRGR